jgi:hypothetical protein
MAFSLQSERITTWQKLGNSLVEGIIAGSIASDPGFTRGIGPKPRGPGARPKPTMT